MCLLLVYACAGRSISRGGGDDDNGDEPPIGVGGSSPGAGGAFPVGGGGTAGSVITRGGTGGRGGTTGQGGTITRGGTGGRGGTAGKGGRGGTGGIGGSNIAGEDSGGFGGSEDCVPTRSGSMSSTQCSTNPTCISLDNPEPDLVGRNEPAEGAAGGAGGEGGAPDDYGEGIASGVHCTRPNGNGFLAFDYYTPPGGAANPGIALWAGNQLCSGYYIGSASFNDYSLPPPGSWTTQCIRVSDIDLIGSVVTVSTNGATRPEPRLKNVRFVDGCVCPREVIRYTTCGNITSGAECR